jgi:hypothetical protein
VRKYRDYSGDLGNCKIHSNIRKLHACPSCINIEPCALPSLNTDTGASIAGLAGKVEQVQCGIITSRYDELQYA